MLTRQFHRNFGNALTPTEEYNARRAAGEFADPIEVDGGDDATGDVATTCHAEIHPQL
jgi:hypothetical protein